MTIRSQAPGPKGLHADLGVVTSGRRHLNLVTVVVSSIHEYSSNLESLDMTTAARTIRFHLRATPQQKALLRLAAEASNKSMTGFIVEAACHAAEQTLLDRPAADNAGLSDWFMRRPPWAE